MRRTNVFPQIALLKLLLIFVIYIVSLDTAYSADPPPPTANFTIAFQGGNKICLSSGQFTKNVNIIVQNFSIDPSNTAYTFYYYLNGNNLGKTSSTTITVNNVKDGDKIKIVAADPGDVNKKYWEQEITADMTTIPNYTLSVLTSTVCLDKDGNNGTVRLKIAPYSATATYDFHANVGGNPSTPFVDKKDGTFERVVNGIDDNSNFSYFVTVADNGCTSNNVYSGNITFKRSQALVERGTTVTLYMSQTSNYELRNLFTNFTTNDKYTFKSIKGSPYIYSNGSGVWVFDVTKAKEGSYKDSISYTPKEGGCAGGETVVKTEIRVVNDKASLPSFLKTTRELPICKNESSFPLVALVRSGVEPSSLNSDDVIIYVQDDNGLHAISNANKNYGGFESSIGCYLFNFNIEPIKYSTANDVVNIIVLVPSTGGIVSGKITITKPQDVFITGLPEPDKDNITYLCSSSADTVSMRGVPSGTGGSYVIEKGKFESGVYKFKQIGATDLRYKNYNSPVGDPSLEKFVATDVFKRVISSDYDSLIRITYISPRPCPDSQSVVLKFKKPVEISFSHPKDTICFGEELQLDIVGTISSGDVFNWNFGDGERISSSGPSISYRYRKPGKYAVRFQTDIPTLDPSLNCNNDQVDSIWVGAKPVVSYNTYDNNFGGNIKLKTTSKILSPNLSEPKDTIITWDWKFSGGLADQQGKTVSFTCPPVEKNPYRMVHIASTYWGCTDSAVVNVPVFPVYSVSPDKFDRESFEPSSKNGWYHSGQYYKDTTRSSWKNVAPNGKTIKALTAGNTAWFTNAKGNGGYNERESSWVESPVYEIGNLKLPMVSFDAWTNMFGPFDGAAVQYAFVDTTAFGKEKWYTLGKINDGLNWYNSNSVLGKPGGTNDGWTDSKTTDWSLAAFRLNDVLDSVKSKPFHTRIRFRVVLGVKSDGAGLDGFAFDNFYVGQRNRKIIVEDFCDYKSYVDTANKYFVDPQALRIQYHLNTFLNDDEIYKQNPYEPSARGLLYGIGIGLPRVVLDGKFYENDKKYSEWSQKSLLERSLIVSPYKITLTNTVGTEELSVVAKVEKFAGVTEKKNYVLQIAVVEKEVVGNGVTFTNVLRNMLPNAAGHRIDKNFIWKDTTITATWKPSIEPQSDAYVIAFLQDEDTKEIYQSEYDTVELADYGKLYSPKRPGGPAKSISFTDFLLSPNPTSGSIMVKFDGVLKDDYSWSVIDMLGNPRNEGRMLYGTNATLLSTDGLDTGMYYLRLEGEGRSFTKKFSVIK